MKKLTTNIQKKKTIIEAIKSGLVSSGTGDK